MPGPYHGLSRPFHERSPRLLILFVILAGAAGLFFGLPNALLHLPPLALLFPFSLYLLSGMAGTGRQALITGWLAGLVANAACLYWLVYPMNDVAGIPFTLALPTTLLLHACLACYSALTVYAMWGFRGFFVTQNPWLAVLPPLLGALAFAGLEVAGGHILSGFPWLALGSALAFDPFWVQTASLYGGHGLGAVMACAAACTAAAFQAGAGQSRKILLITAFLAPCLLAAHGLARWHYEGPKDEPLLSLVMVQGNIDQNQKWAPEFQKSTLDHYINLSRSALAKAGRDNPDKPVSLLIWPETAMPFYYPLHREYARELRNFTKETGIHLAFGAVGVERVKGRDELRNRFLLLPPTDDMAIWYDKRHLVPFGEYNPLATFLPYLQKLMQGVDFTPGHSASPLSLPLREKQELSLGVLICYEVIFPELAAQSVAEGAQIFISASNDGWFRRSSAPFQHLAHAVLRAVEQQRPLVRATNTGISVVISDRGVIEEHIDGMFTSGALQAFVRPGKGYSVYHRLRPLPELILLAAAFAGLALAIRKSYLIKP